jgi:hypothetical protein
LPQFSQRLQPVTLAQGLQKPMIIQQQGAGHAWPVQQDSQQTQGCQQQSPWQLGLI